MSQISTPLGWVAGIIVMITCIHFMPPRECADGTSSSAIGRRGACSHHGGVSDHGFLHLLALGASVATGFAVSRIVTFGAQRIQGKSTPYGTLRQYESHLRRLGISEEQIIEATKQYRT